MDLSRISKNIRSVRAHIPAGVTLVCVSKFQPIQAIQEAYQAGERHFGESRVQELKQKATQLPNDIQWHFIGHLQTNKVRDILKLKPYIIESVDSKRLLHAINTEAEKLGIIQNILLEVHVAQEETKSGFTPNELTTLLSTDICASLPNIRICGLMSMATNTEDKTEIRRCFSNAATLASNIQHLTSDIQHTTSNIILSMGMSDDYKIAIEYGSNSVRIGSSIFGEREYPHKLSSFKAIFFDMDGVLFDSMPYHAKAWEEVMRANGLPFTEYDAYLNEGRTGQSVIQEASNIVNKPCTDQQIEEIYRQKAEAFKRMQPNGAQPMDGIREVLSFLHEQNIKVWVVTGSGQLSLFAQLSTLHPTLFVREQLITAYDVTHGKPHPEPYLKAWERSGFKKEECCVVENAPLGVRAAKSAGLFTIAVNTGILENERLSQEKADLVLPNMHALLQWLQEHMKE